MKRKSGYYWVRKKNAEYGEVAFIDSNGYIWLTGSSFQFRECNFDFIDDSFILQSDRAHVDAKKSMYGR